MTLNDAIERMFSPSYYGVVSWRQETSPDILQSKFLVINIKEGTFEVPLILGRQLGSNLYSLYQQKGTYVTELKTNGYCPNYKTLESKLKDALVLSMSRYSPSYLYSIREEDNLYFVSRGVIFDRELSPLMICSWMFDQTDDHLIMYPIMRISPRCFTGEQNKLTRFLTGRWLKTSLGVEIGIGYYYEGQSIPNHNIKVIIEESPFEIRKTKSPSAKTSNEDLLKLATDFLNSTTII